MVSTKRVQTLDDLKGVKMRTSGAWAEIGARLGMSTVSMAGSDIYASLERGVNVLLEWGASREMGSPNTISSRASSNRLLRPSAYSTRKSGMA